MYNLDKMNQSFVNSRRKKILVTDPPITDSYVLVAQTLAAWSQALVDIVKDDLPSGVEMAETAASIDDETHLSAAQP